MYTLRFPALADSQLVQIVDAALAATAIKSGPWLVCKPGCAQCCVGVFAFNQLDTARLRRGMAELESQDGGRAMEVRRRVADSIARLRADFPGDPQTGLLREGVEAEESFESFANDEVCPVLDPQTGTCDLYASRPMTCRVFGPPVRSKISGTTSAATTDSDEDAEDGLGVCELCYHGATPEEIAACEMVPDPDGLEATLLQTVEQDSDVRGQTIVSFALAHSSRFTAQPAG